MKVLICSSTFPASESDPVPRFVYDQLASIKVISTELDFIVIAPHNSHSQTKSQQHKEFKELRYHYFFPFSLEKLTGRGIGNSLQQNPLLYLQIPFLMLATFFVLLYQTRKHKPDYIYAHWFMPQGVVAALVAKLTHTPWVLTSHASDVSILGRLPFFGKRIVRSLLPSASKITAVSKKTEAKMRSFFSDEEWDRVILPKFKIIPMGINLPKTPVTTTTPNVSEILFIGRLVEKKGVNYLLEAMAQLKEEGIKVHLSIAGDGQLKNQLAEQAKQLDLLGKSVEFLGYLHDKSKQAAINSAGIVVVPSINTKSGDSEGLPVAVLEALSFGKICIASDASGAEDCIKDDINGFIVPEKDPDALAAKIKTVLKSPASELLKIRSNAMQSAQKFTWHKIAQEHIEFLWDNKRA